MLINALCDYYDILASAGKVLPEGYSKVNIHYLISLTPEGIVDGIVDCQETKKIPVGKKEKEVKVPLEAVMPQRTEKTGIDANIAEHRPLYIFGLNYENDGFNPDDRTGKARKSHTVFVEKNLEFTEGMTDPLITAYRDFLKKWEPEQESNNEFLKGLGKDYGKSGYSFCLSGNPDYRLYEVPELKEKWDRINSEKTPEKDAYIAQCAVTGKQEAIARIHGKIKGVAGGLATGSVLISFKNSSENSYGNEQSYNSGISETAMKKYTEALNYLLGSRKHKIILDDMTILFWAMNREETCEDRFLQMLFGQSDQMNAEQTEQMLADMAADSRKGIMSRERLDSLDMIQDNVDFYMVGIKPNSSRLSVKFIMKKKYADVLWNIAKFQADMQITKKFRPVSVFRIKEELISPKSSNEKVNPAMISRLFESIIYGGKLPVALLETVVRRVKTDKVDEVHDIVRVGLIKAFINRMSMKEEIKVGYDNENITQAYLCGQLFAVLEEIQQKSTESKLNRTIKDTYFASATSKPSLVFPKLIRLSNNHLNKIKDPKKRNEFDSILSMIIGKLDNEFPDHLDLKDQGRFIVGYYKQHKRYFINKDKNEEDE